MAAPSKITLLGHMVAADLAAGGPAEASFAAAQMMDETPEAALELLDLLLEQASDARRAKTEKAAPKTSDKAPSKGKSKKKPTKSDADERLLEAYAYLLANALEVLRYEVELGKSGALALLDRLRHRVLAASQDERVEPHMLMMILSQFVTAKLDLGEDLRSAMQNAIESDSPELSEAAAMDDIARHLAQVAEDLDGNPYAIHSCLAETAGTMPDDVRATLIMAAFAQGSPAIREAFVGWLLDSASIVRRNVAHMLGDGDGAVSGTMLRRMIAIRNWLPERDRPKLDDAIRAQRLKNVACASWPKTKLLELYVTGFDGSGAQSILGVVSEGRKRAVAGVLLKQHFGVRDAWVQHGAATAEARSIIATMDSQTVLIPTTLKYVLEAVRYFLGVNAHANLMPPFNLLDFAETIGLSEINPEHAPVEEFIASLCSELTTEHFTEAAVAKALKASGQWVHRNHTLESWFEDGDDVIAVLNQKKLSQAKRKTLLLSGPLQKRRRHWAELVALTALTIKHEPQGAGWEEMVVVARELLGSRPLNEFGVMNEVVNTTIAVHTGI
jgi:hypothetical protein